MHARGGGKRVMLRAALLCCAGCMPSLEQYYPDGASTGAGAGAGSACTAFEAAGIVAEDSAGPGVLLLRDERIFWLDQVAPFGVAMADKLGGGEPTIIVGQSATYSDDSPIFPPGQPPLDLGSDGTLVYWVGANNQGSSIILWANEQALVGYTVAADYPSVIHLVVDANNSYFPFDTDVYKAPNRQSTEVVLASGTAPLALALGPTDVYFTDVDGRVRQVNKSGVAEATVIAEDQGSAFGIAADEAGAYWTTDGGTVSASLGGAPVVALAEDRNAPTEIAVDDHAVYWVEPDAGRVMCIPKGGGEPVTFAADQGGPTDVAVDETGVYWANKSGGQIMARYRPGVR